jgi:hypothetical protein
MILKIITDFWYLNTLIIITEKVVCNLLKLNDVKVSFVEDITGGELCSRLIKQDIMVKDHLEQSYVLLSNILSNWPKRQVKTFYLNEVQYNFLEGMDWNEWVNSSYNTTQTGYFTIIGEQILVGLESSVDRGQLMWYENVIKPTDIIDETYEYSVVK